MPTSSLMQANVATATRISTLATPYMGVIAGHGHLRSALTLNMCMEGIHTTLTVHCAIMRASTTLSVRRCLLLLQGNKALQLTVDDCFFSCCLPVLKEIWFFAL